MAIAPAGSRPSGATPPTPGPQATTPANAARANGGTRGRERRSTCRVAAKRLYVATPSYLATTPVNAARANGGRCGRKWGSPSATIVLLTDCLGTRTNAARMPFLHPGIVNYP